jgi:hypothetical protein
MLPISFLSVMLLHAKIANVADAGDVADLLEAENKKSAHTTFLQKNTDDLLVNTRSAGNSLLPGEGDVWELINDEHIAEELPYLKNRGDVPQCLQGLIWMDQQCTTWHEMPWGYFCATLDGLEVQDEFTTGFKNWDGRCFSLAREAWTFGRASIYGDICKDGDVVFCQTNQDTHDACDDGASFKGPGPYHMVKTSFGWDRYTSPELSHPLPLHYPVLQVVDWKGANTKWFEYYWNEVNRRFLCPLKQLNCKRNQWAWTNQVARCLRAIDR